MTCRAWNGLLLRLADVLVQLAVQLLGTQLRLLRMAPASAAAPTACGRGGRGAGLAGGAAAARVAGNHGATGRRGALADHEIPRQNVRSGARQSLFSHKGLQGLHGPTHVRSARRLGGGRDAAVPLDYQRLAWDVGRLHATQGTLGRLVRLSGVTADHRAQHVETRTVQGAVVQRVNGVLGVGAVLVVDVGNAERAAGVVEADVALGHRANAVEEFLDYGRARPSASVRAPLVSFVGSRARGQRWLATYPQLLLGHIVVQVADAQAEDRASDGGAQVAGTAEHLVGRQTAAE